MHGWNFEFLSKIIFITYIKKARKIFILNKKNPLIGQIYFLGGGKVYLFLYVMCAYLADTQIFKNVILWILSSWYLLLLLTPQILWIFIHTSGQNILFSKVQVMMKSWNCGSFHSWVIIFPRKNVLQKLLYWKYYRNFLIKYSKNKIIVGFIYC